MTPCLEHTSWNGSRLCGSRADLGLEWGKHYAQGTVFEEALIPGLCVRIS